MRKLITCSETARHAPLSHHLPLTFEGLGIGVGIAFSNDFLNLISNFFVNVLLKIYINMYIFHIRICIYHRFYYIINVMLEEEKLVCLEYLLI